MADPVQVPSAAEPPRPLRGWGRRIILATVGVAVVVVLAVVALVGSGKGQRFVLDQILDRAQKTFEGPLTVETIRSPSLLAGATLVGVRLDARGGRPFLTVDSIRMHYSLLSLLTGRPRVSSVMLWGPHVEVSRYPGEDQSNVDHLLRPQGPVTDSSRVTREIAVSRIGIRDARVDILSPLAAGASPRTLTAAAPGGHGRLQRISLDSLDLDLDDVFLRFGGTQPLQATLSSLSLDAYVFDDPLRITDARGSLSYGVGGLDLRNATLSLPHSTLDGEVRFGPQTGEGSAWALAANVETRGRGSLSDLKWLDARIPDGSFDGGITLTSGQGLDARFHDLRVDLEASQLLLDGGISLGRNVEMSHLSVEASPLLVSRLEPWLGRKLPLQGWLRGNLTLSGSLDALSTTGRMTLVPSGFGGMPSTVSFRGVMHTRRDPGFTGFQARLDPLNFGVVTALAPGVTLPGSGQATVSLSGRVDEGVHVVLDATQGADSASHVTVHGSVERVGGGTWSVDLHSELAPLSLAFLAKIRPNLDLQGTMAGTLHATGPLDSLHVTGDLTGAGGRLALDGTVDARAPASRYQLDAKLADVAVSRLVGRLPRPTAWSGHLRVDGRGVSPDSVDAVVTLEAGRSRFGGLRIDTVETRLHASGGLVAIDTLAADLGGVHLYGSGSLGMVGTRHGKARVRFVSDSLIGLRPIFMGDTVIARDTLSVLEKELLRFQGVNPDALPDTAEVAMAGALHGEAHLSGSFDSLDVDATARLRSGVYRLDRVDSATLQVQARGYGSSGSRLHFSLNAGGVRALARTAEAVHIEGDLSGGRGESSVAIRRRPGEVYSAAGTFAVDSSGGSVDLRTASATFDSLAWRMARPTRIAWDSSSITVDSLKIARSGTEPMSLTASGTLSRTGESDFRLDASGLELARVARVAQRESSDVEGRLDLSVRVTGPAAEPVIGGSFDLADAQYGDMKVARLGGTMDYRNRKARVELDAWNADRKVLTARGTVPVNLALTRVHDRTSPVPMDLQVRADSLDASVVLSYITVLENVKGTVSGDFHVGGTLNRPEPSGSLQLEDAAWSIPAIGVRHTRINGKLTLHPDRTVDVRLAERAGGTSDVTGRIVLEPLSNPRLDTLRIHFSGFQAVDRKDVAGRISGNLTLTGTYDRPKMGGKLTVDQGTLYLEEFARSSEVVDLTDPDVFNVVDTTVLSSRPVLADLRNPFLDNLRVSVDLSVPRDTWLRSRDMNVEIGTPAGSPLVVTYDRLKRDMVLVGELDALRGSYTVLGRRFEVVSQSSTVGFVGTPGINPTLDIQAVSRIRRVGNDPLSVTATVSGTLTQPRVSLSTDEQGVPQSDLVSYLVFGRPAHELSSGQSALVQGATGAGVTYLTGVAANRIGAAVAQQIGVDYLSISQAGDFQAGNLGILSTALANTQVEIGQYINQNVFVVVVLRKPTEGASTAGWLGGARVDWALSDNYNAQGFVEDRFLRSQTPGLAELGQNSQIVGVFIYREWGY